MSYNGSGTFVINTSGQPVVTGTPISSTVFNALTADLATGLSTAITKDGQTATTARIPFAQGINSTLVTDSTSTTTGSIITAGGAGVAKALFVGTTANVAGAVTLQSTLGVTGITTFSAQPIFSSLTASSAVATDASKGLVSVTNTGTGNNVLATSPTLVTPVLGAASATSVTVAAGAVGTPSITTAGDTNTGIFFPAADTIAFAEGGAEAMRIDSSGNVGIGTTTSLSRLTSLGTSSTVANSASTRNPVASLRGGNDNNRLDVYVDNSGATSIMGLGAYNTAGGNTALALYTGPSVTEAMRIDSSGNVGIGTASPAFGDGSGIEVSRSGTATFRATSNGQGVEFRNNAGTAEIDTRGAFPIKLLTNQIERMRIDSSGNVGIGTSSPSTKLHINNASGISTYLRAENTNGYALFGVDASGNAYAGAETNDAFGLVTNGTYRLYIEAAGNVGIGTSSPTNKLHVVGTAKIEGSTLDLNDAGTFTISQNTTSSALVLRTAASSYMRFDTNGSNERMRIDSSGYLLVNQTSNTTSSYVQIYGAQPALSVESTSTGGVNQIIIKNPNGTVGSISTSGSSTAFNTSSDYRLKDAITPMTGALAKVALLKPCTYKWKVDGSDGQGFIAHELDEVVPGCVTGEKDAVQEQEYEVTPAVKDEEGNTITEAVMGTRIVPVYQGIDTSFLVATLTAAIQEQQALIQALTTRITTLENK